MIQQIRLGNGERVVVEVTPPAGADATTAVYVHGLGSHRGGDKARFLERELVARGFGFVRFDLRGHGESDGKLEALTLTRQLEDVDAVLTHLARGAAGPVPRRVVLIGASLGALTTAWRSALAAKERPAPLPIFAQVLIAPAFKIVERYLAALGEFGRARWQREGTYRFVGPWFEFDLKWDVIVDGEDYPQARLVRATTLPTLILHGTRDETAPISLSREFVAEQAQLAGAGRSARLVAIEGGDHRLTDHKERLLAEIVSFVAEAKAGAHACAS